MIKRKKKQLLIKTLNPNEKEIRHSIVDIEKTLIKIFKNHIGKENAISSVELFDKVYNIEAQSINVFERAYLWNVLKAILMRLRSTEVLFVVNNSFDFYVLKTNDELKEYEGKVDRLIAGLNDIKAKARKWVSGRKWDNL